MSTENEVDESDHYLKREPFYNEVVDHLKYRESIIFPYCKSLEPYYDSMDSHLKDIKDNVDGLPNILTRSVSYPDFPKSKQDMIDEYNQAKATFDKKFNKRNAKRKVKYTQEEYDEELFNSIAEFDYESKRYVKTGNFIYDESRYDKEFVLLNDYYKSIIEYYDVVFGFNAMPKFTAPPKPIVPWTDSLARKFIMIVEGLSQKWNYRQYTWIDEMRQDAKMNIMAYGHNFNYEKFDSPFSYYNMIAWQAFVQRIKREKKEQEKKYKYVIEHYHIDDDLFLEDGGDHIEVLNKLTEMFSEKLKEAEEKATEEDE